MSKIVACDVDGILADFNVGFKNLIVESSGRDLFGDGWTPRDITTWNYAKDQYGYTREEDKEAWSLVKASPTFWFDLPPLEGAEKFLTDLLDLPHDVYFITNRMGTHVKIQTEEWLYAHGFRDVPTVLISADKDLICEGLGITHYIDDKQENCVDVSGVPNVSTYMLAQSWNRQVNVFTNQPIPRINTLQEFMDVIKEDEV